MMKFFVAAALIVIALPSLAWAGIPEIDMSAAPAGFALLAGALVVLRSRRKQ